MSFNSYSMCWLEVLHEGLGKDLGSWTHVNSIFTTKLVWPTNFLPTLIVLISVDVDEEELNNVAAHDGSCALLV